MVRSVNGDRGSSVIPIKGDDYLYLGRGRHVWVDDGDVHMNGTSGQTLSQGIVASGNSKYNQMKNVGAAMKLMLLLPLETEGDFLLTCDSGWALEA